MRLLFFALYSTPNMKEVKSMNTVIKVLVGIVLFISWSYFMLYCGAMSHKMYTERKEELYREREKLYRKFNIED